MLGARWYSAEAEQKAGEQSTKPDEGSSAETKDAPASECEQKLKKKEEEVQDLVVRPPVPCQIQWFANVVLLCDRAACGICRPTS